MKLIREDGFKKLKFCERSELNIAFDY